jgi:hypothetical protein
MSSTLRGYERHKSDYYLTPIDKINEFLAEFLKEEPQALKGNILDPCAGGDQKNEMSYPLALIQNGVNKDNILTVDIREDSKAEIKKDYLTFNSGKFLTIITNPPFNLAMSIIEKALEEVQENGFVIMLLRLNFFGSKDRKPFWEKHLPKYCYVHHRRMSFTPDNKTDSIEYAHFVWQKGLKPDFTKLKVI